MPVVYFGSFYDDEIYPISGFQHSEPSKPPVEPEVKYVNMVSPKAAKLIPPVQLPKVRLRNQLSRVLDPSLSPTLMH